MQRIASHGEKTSAFRTRKGSTFLNAVALVRQKCSVHECGLQEGQYRACTLFSPAKPIVEVFCFHEQDGAGSSRAKNDHLYNFMATARVMGAVHATPSTANDSVL
jgi:hypothetical protein